jgi:hypothetical protein
MNIIIGSSRCKDLEENGAPAVKPICRSLVYTWGPIMPDEDLVDNHMVYHHGGPMSFTGLPYFYIVAGLCNVTKKINIIIAHYTRVIFDSDPSETAIAAFKEIKKLKKKIFRHTKRYPFSA